MARKILNRKELREEAEAAERQEEADADEEMEADEESEEEAEEEKPAPKKKAPAKRKSRSKTPKEVRLKAFWGVFSQSMRRVALFEYSQRSQADKKAAEMSESQKAPHFVQVVKEVIEE